MNIVERHPWKSLAVVAALYLVVGRMDYDDAVRAAEPTVRIEGGPCRLPTDNEFRLWVQTTRPDGTLHTRCFIEPFSLTEPPSHTIRRILKERIKT